MSSFQNHDINAHANWKAKHIPMAPMFAQTMTSQLTSPGPDNSSFNDSTDPILATQESLMFEPTADFVGKVTCLYKLF